MDKLAFLNTAKEFWGTLNSAQKFITALFVSLGLVVLGVVSVVATRPQNAVLFSGLQPEDSGAIVSKLQEQRIPYEIDGTAIKVPSSKVHELRMELASQGLPQGGTVGFEIFDKTTFGMTEFTQRLNKQRALQGELTRTLDELDGVLQSRVHIAVPEPSVYSDKQQIPTASVVLKLRVGRTLDGNQVAGIVHLVSSAVEGMKPSGVTVIDTNGNVLSEGADEATGLDPRMSASQLRLKREHEQEVEKDIQTMLEHVLGPNKAIVRVSAKMNFDRTETNSEEYMPNVNPAVQRTGAQTTPGLTGVVTSEETTTETYTGNGIQGAQSPMRQTNVRGGPGDYNREQKTHSYEVSKTTKHTVQSPGQVDRLSVAVMLDKTGTIDETAIRNAVIAAAGLDLKKDQLSVTSMAFDDSARRAEDKEMQVAEKQALYISLGKTVGGALLLVGFLVALGRMLNPAKKRKKKKGEATDVLPASGTTPSLDMIIPPTFAPLIEELEEREPVAVGATSKINDIAQTQPEEIAEVIRKWMSEE